MTTADKLQQTLLSNRDKVPSYLERINPINARIRGWSKVSHYLFFKSFLEAFPEAKNILIVGVYLGRDISYMLDAAGDRPLNITGVDKFNAEPCDDWPAEKRHMTWEEAFNCPPPDIETASKNINVQLPSRLFLYQMDDAKYLEDGGKPFDLIFLDASHEYASISRQIRACHKLCHPTTVISGDDYANVQPGWGVTEAVTEAFKFHYHIDHRIWFAGAEDYA